MRRLRPSIVVSAPLDALNARFQQIPPAIPPASHPARHSSAMNDDYSDVDDGGSNGDNNDDDNDDGDDNQVYDGDESADDNGDAAGYTVNDDDADDVGEDSYEDQDEEEEEEVDEYAENPVASTIDITGDRFTRGRRGLRGDTGNEGHNENDDEGRPGQTNEHDYELDGYETKLSALSQLLDRRADTLQRAEVRLHAEREHVSSAGMSAKSVLSELRERQRRVAVRERVLADAKRVLDAKFDTAKTVLGRAKRVEKRLRTQQRELNVVRDKVARHTDHLRQQRAHLADARTRQDETSRANEQLLADKAALSGAIAKMTGVHAQLRAKEGELARVDARLQAVADAERVDALLTPLHGLLEQLCALTDGDGDGDGADGSRGAENGTVLQQLQQPRRANARQAHEAAEQGVHYALSRLTEARDVLTRLRARRVAADERERALALREAELARRERRGAAAREDERRVARARAALAQRERILAERGGALDKRDDDVKARHDEAVAAADDAERRREHVAALERTLEHKERSIARALASVEARERASDARDRQLATERDAVADMRREVETKHSLLHARELEITARAFNQNNHQNNNNNNNSHTLHHNTASASATGEQHLPSTALDERGLRQQQQQDQQQQQQPTVRRHLAFDTAAKSGFDGGRRSVSGSHFAAPLRADPTADHHQQYQQRQQQDRDDVEDDDDATSEVAAGQLLPELMSARSVWRERIERVAQSVRQTLHATSADRPHLVHALTRAGAELQRVLLEVETAPVPSSDGDASSKQAYLSEKQLQLRWGAVLKQQYEIFTEITTGVLISTDHTAQTDPPVQTPQSYGTGGGSKGDRVTDWSASRSSAQSHTSRNTQDDEPRRVYFDGDGEHGSQTRSTGSFAVTRRR